jgi:hypothetical protein
MTQSLDTKLSTSSSIASDSHKIIMGAGYRLPTAPTHVADKGKVVTGAGYRLPTERNAA